MIIEHRYGDNEANIENIIKAILLLIEILKKEEEGNKPG